MTNVVIYTDGAFSAMRDQGGVGIVILNEGKKVLEYSNMYKKTTNNQMELGAVIIALRLIKEPCNSILIYTDSQYVIGCARVSELCSDIKFSYVKGHNGDHWNEYCDKIAVKASQLI